MKLEQEVGAETAEVPSCLSLSVLLWLSGAGGVSHAPGIFFAKAAHFDCGCLSCGAVAPQEGLCAWQQEAVLGQRSPGRGP